MFNHITRTILDHAKLPILKEVFHRLSFHTKEWIARYLNGRNHLVLFIEKHTNANNGHHLSEVLNILLTFQNPLLLQRLEFTYPNSSELQTYFQQEIHWYHEISTTQQRDIELEKHECSKAKLFFYLLRNLIRRASSDGNGETAMDSNQFHLFCEIASSSSVISSLLHTEVTRNRPNELLTLAASEQNHPIVRYLLMNFPQIRKSAKSVLLRVETEEELAIFTESSMRALTYMEESTFTGCLKAYKQQCEEAFGDADVVLERIRMHLATLFQQLSLSMVKENGQRCHLPLTWEAFVHLNLQGNDRNIALREYYKCKLHTAWRYLTPNNPWLDPDPNADYMERTRISQERFKDLIAQIYLAVTDESASPSTGDFTIEHRTLIFFAELAMINRAHNWEGPEDDLQADRPSCVGGVRRRLLQSDYYNLFVNILK
jgi:hypothetical protein